MKEGLAEEALPGWLRAVAVATEPDVVARLVSLLTNWADSHQTRPRVVLDLWAGQPPLTRAAATVLMGCVC